MSYDVKKYIIEKYIKLHVLDKDGNKLIKSGMDFNIYPEEQSIPFCTVCSTMYSDFKNNFEDPVVEAPHVNCGCLWFEYFSNKILAMNSKIILVRRKERKEHKNDKIDDNNKKSKTKQPVIKQDDKLAKKNKQKKVN